jgi:hypothetical protein
MRLRNRRIGGQKTRLRSHSQLEGHKQNRLEGLELAGFVGLKSGQIGQGGAILSFLFFQQS